MTREDKIKAYTMRLDGYTFQDIADKFGVSKQYIHSLFGGRVSETLVNGCRYPNITGWMANNNMDVCGMRHLLNDMDYRGFRSRLFGKTEFRLSEIKKILHITGMTFEKAFFDREEENQDVK